MQSAESDFWLLYMRLDTWKEILHRIPVYQFEQLDVSS